MSKDNQNLKLRRIQALDQLFELKSAISLLLGNKALSRDNWQVLKSKNIAAKQQEVLAPWKNPDKTGQPSTTRHICDANQPLKKGCPVLSRFACSRIVTKVGVTKNLANIGRLHNNTDYLLCAADHSKGACLYLPTFNARGAV